MERPKPLARVYLGVGSNLGERELNLEKAKALASAIPHTRFLRSSRVIETDPVGVDPSHGKYLNAVWELETELPPQKLKEALQRIEGTLGRKRGILSTPREIDLDILFYGDQRVDEGDLKIPHPRLHERAFVLVPLAELAPELVHPQLKRSVRELRESCPGS